MKGIGMTLGTDAVTNNGRRITRNDLEAAFGKLLGEGPRTTAGIPAPVVVAAAVAVASLVLAFLLGKRRGTKRSAVVEIRRL